MMFEDKELSTNLYLKHLSLDLSVEKLQKVAEEYGKVHRCKIMREDNNDPKSPSTGTGFVNFENAQSAQKAMKNLPNRDELAAKGMTLYVARAQRKAERQAELEAIFGEGSSQSNPREQGIDLSMYFEKAFQENAKGTARSSKSRQAKGNSSGQGSKGSSKALDPTSPEYGKQQAQHQPGTAPAAVGPVRSGQTVTWPASSAAPASGDAQQKFQPRAQPLPRPATSVAATADTYLPPPPTMADRLKAKNVQQQAELALRKAPQGQSPQHHTQQQAQSTPSPQQQGMEQPVNSTFGRSWPTSPWLPHLAATGTSAHQIASPSTPGTLASAPSPGMPSHVPSPLQSGLSSSASPATPQPSRNTVQQASNWQPGMPPNVPLPFQSGMSSSASPVTPQPRRNQVQQGSNRQPGMPPDVPSPLPSGMSSIAGAETPQPSRIQSQQASSQQPGVPSHMPPPSQSSASSARPIRPPQSNQMQQASSQQLGTPHPGVLPFPGSIQPAHSLPAPSQAPALRQSLPMMSMPPMTIFGSPMPMASMPIPPTYGQIPAPYGPPLVPGHPGLLQPHLPYGTYPPVPYVAAPAHPPLGQPALPFGGTPPPPHVLREQADSDLRSLHSQIVRRSNISCYIMIQKLCEQWNCQTERQALEMMGLDDWYSLPYLRELRVWEEQVDNNIESYGQTYIFAATLEDLAFNIDHCQDANECEVESWLGPLICHPRVQKIFGHSADELAKMPKVTTMDCRTALQHLRDHPRSKGKRIHFREHDIKAELMKMLGVKHPSRLCVKINEAHIPMVIKSLQQSGNVEASSFEVLSEEYHKGNAPQALKNSGKFGLRDKVNRLLPLSEDVQETDVTVDAPWQHTGAPKVGVRHSGQQVVSEQPIGRGPRAEGRLSHATSLLQQQAAESAAMQESASMRPEAAGSSPLLQQQASDASASAPVAVPTAEAATQDAERALSGTLSEQAGESVGEAEHGDADQPSYASVKELAAYVKEELRKALGAHNGTKTSADGFMALIKIEQRILNSSQVAKVGFGKLTQGACSSMLDLLAMEPDLVKELLPSFQLPTANIEGLEGLPAASASQPRTPSVLLLCAVKQAAEAWDRAAGHIQQLTQQQRAEAKQEALAASLCAQFGVRSVEELGFGSAEQLMADESGDMHSDVVAACALTCGAKGAAAHHQPLAVLGVEERHLKDTAVAMLQAAPNFVDLGEWCQWDLAFGFRFGPLASSDILHEAAMHSAMSENGARWCALVLPGGHALKLPHPTPQMELLEDFEHSVQQLDVAATVQGMLSLLLLERTCSVAVVQRLKDRVRSALKAAIDPSGGCQDKSDHLQLCNFALDCLKLLPRPVCPLLAPVVLDTVPEVLGVARADVERQMLDGAVNAKKEGASGCQVLVHLGLALGVSPWMEHFKLRTMERTAEKGFKDGLNRQADYEESESFMAQPQEMDSGCQIQPNAEDMSSSIENQDAVPPMPTVQAIAEPDASSNVDIEKAQEHISTIRKKYGRDGAKVNIPEDLLNSVARAMEALGIKQNTDNSHFMLEVVQNADDNNYTEGTVPWIGFEICEDSIHVANNEVGFSEKSMHELCQLCGTEKSAGQGKTGNKGIGFKSVFKVTHAAHVQSNAYRVKFDVKADDLGYIVPQWLETPMPLALWSECRTHLVLPLQKELQNSILGGKLRDRLREAFAPKLLVFLKKLKMLTMVDRVKQQRIELQRKSAGDGRLEVTKRVYSLASNSQVPISLETVCFLVVKEGAHLEPPVLRRKGMDPCKCTSMELAFQLPSRSSSKDDPERQLVYAYLPMKDYGLRFLLNADFETTTNREAIDEGNPYNQKTLGLFAPLVKKAFLVLSKQEFPPGRELSGLDWWLKCLPRKTEVVDKTFDDPIEQLTSSLQKTSCIPTEHGALVRPSQAAVCTDPVVADLLDKLRQHPGFAKQDLVHRNCTALYDGDRAKQLQQQLGVHRFSAEQLPSLAREVANHPKVLDALGTDWMAKLLQCVLNMPPSLGRTKAMEVMRTLPLLKLSGINGKYAAAAGVEASEMDRLRELPNASQRPLPLFFPVGHFDAKGVLQAQLTEAGGPFAPERLPLPQLDPVLLQQVGGKASTVMAHHLRQRLRDEMGVQEMTADHVLSLYILPLFQWHEQQLHQGAQPQLSSLERQQEDDEELLAALRFVVLSKRQLDEENLKKVKDCAVVVVVDSKGRSRRCCMSLETPVYIPYQLGNDIDLSADFPSYIWSMLSAKYAGRHTADSGSSLSSISAAQWRDALLELGAHTWLPILQPLPKALRGSDLQTRAVDPNHSRLESESSGGIPCGDGDAYLIEDAECPAFEDLVHVICKSKSALRTQQLLRLQGQIADHLQHNNYRKALRTKAHVSMGGAQSSKQHDADSSIIVHTSFALSLRNLPWLLNDERGREVPMEPCKLFTAQFKQYLTDKVKYVHSQTNPDLLRFGVNQEPSLKLMLDVLKSWAGHETEPDCGNEWFSSVPDMDKVYSFILQQAWHGGHPAQEYVWNAFKEFPLLWMPYKKDWSNFKLKLDSTQMMGRFYHIRVARQGDGANAMEAIDWDRQHIRILGLYYKKWGKFNKLINKGALFRTPLYHPDFEAAANNEEAEEEEEDGDDDEEGEGAEETPAQQQSTLSEGMRCLVPCSPSTEEYVTALELLRDRNPKLNSREDNGFISNIFKRLWEKRLGTGELEAEELRDHLHTTRRVFPTTKGWASWQDAIYHNDNTPLAAKLAQMNKPVKFLAIPSPLREVSPGNPDVPNFYKAVWMPSLRRSTAPVSLRYGVPVEQGKEDVTALCKEALLCMQRVIRKDNTSMYTVLSDLGISQVLPYLTVELLKGVPIMDMALLSPLGPIALADTSRQDAALVFGRSTVCLYLQASPGRTFDTASAGRELSRLFSAEAISNLAEGVPLRRYPEQNLDLQQQLAELLRGPDMEKLMQGFPQVPDGEPSWLDGAAAIGPFANPTPISAATYPPEDHPPSGDKNADGSGNAATGQNAQGAGSATTTSSNTAASGSIGSSTQAHAVVPRSSDPAAGELVEVPTVTLASPDANKVVNAKWKQAQLHARVKEKQKEWEDKRRQRREGQLQEKQQPQKQQPQAGMMSSLQVQHYSAEDVRRAMTAADVMSRDTGKRGEKLAAQALIKSLSREYKVRWMDENGSTFKPYDIKVEPAMDERARSAGAKCSLVEVKSTASIPPRGHVEFHLSPNEFKAALEHGPAYEVFLVHGPREENPEMRRLPDPAALLKEGKIRVREAVLFSVNDDLAEERRL